MCVPGGVGFGYNCCHSSKGRLLLIEKKAFHFDQQPEPSSSALRTNKEIPTNHNTNTIMIMNLSSHQRFQLLSLLLPSIFVIFASVNVSSVVALKQFDYYYTTTTSNKLLSTLRSRTRITYDSDLLLSLRAGEVDDDGRDDTGTTVTTDDIGTIRTALADLIQTKNCGPILIRLAWHDAGTYDASNQTGGPRGCMRFDDGKQQGEACFGANNGLEIARALLQPIKDTLASGMSYADFWALASIVAIKEMGGPDVPFKMGRNDASSVEESVEEGRHPDADKGSDHLRAIFHRMGLTDQDIVALSGAHTVGRCHLDRSGFDGPWTSEPMKFDNSYFQDLLNKEWKETTTEAGNPQYTDGNEDKTMMLISDLALVSDDKFRPYVEKYAADENAFFQDFAKAYQKLIELGCTDLQEA